MQRLRPLGHDVLINVILYSVLSSCLEADRKYILMLSALFDSVAVLGQNCLDYVAIQAYADMFIRNKEAAFC